MTAGMLLCADPAGNKCELFYGTSSDKETFVSPTSARFTTESMGLGHVFAIVPDGQAFESFYSMLGFRVSDYIDLRPGITATFMHCNQRHHTLAFVEVPGASVLQHVMIEVDSVDSVGRSYDRCLAGAAPIVMTLGRHTNDQMFSFYASSPNGIAVEYGTGGIKIDDSTWTVQRFDAASSWGHARPEPPPSAPEWRTLAPSPGVRACATGEGSSRSGTATPVRPDRAVRVASPDELVHRVLEVSGRTSTNGSGRIPCSGSLQEPP